jgi:hypothetical protein
MDSETDSNRPDADAVRRRFQAHGCAVFDLPDLTRFGVLTVAAGGDLVLMLGRDLTVDERLAMTTAAQLALADPGYVKWGREAGAYCFAMHTSRSSDLVAHIDEEMQRLSTAQES